jgi:hypothetical protein
MLIGKALEVLPSDMDVRLSLASIRISQGLSDVARKVIDGVYEEVVAASSEGRSLHGLTSSGLTLTPSYPFVAGWWWHHHRLHR